MTAIVRMAESFSSVPQEAGEYIAAGKTQVDELAGA